MTNLALLGGDVAFPEGIPFVRPPAPTLERVTEILSDSWKRGSLTNGQLVAELERRTAEHLGVPHVVAVSSCTTGLMLALRALEITGPVVMPSFTFSASAHAVAWNGATPVFAECDPSSFQVALDDLAPRLPGAAAIVATHIFGAPCSPQAVDAIARAAGVPLVFDAAHAFGAVADGTPVGRFGDAEVFSLTPTKPLVAGEGGLVATTRDDVAYRVRIGRDYANPGNYDTEFVGLNGRMSEMHAATALASLEGFAANQARRFEIVARYCDRLREIPGVRVQTVARDRPLDVEGLHDRGRPRDLRGRPRLVAARAQGRRGRHAHLLRSARASPARVSAGRPGRSLGRPAGHGRGGEPGAQPSCVSRAAKTTWSTASSL